MASVGCMGRPQDSHKTYAGYQHTRGPPSSCHPLPPIVQISQRKIRHEKVTLWHIYFKIPSCNVQTAVIFYRQQHVCPVSSLICSINRLLHPAHFSFTSRLLTLSYCLTWHLFRCTTDQDPLRRLLFCIIIFFPVPPCLPSHYLFLSPTYFFPCCVFAFCTVFWKCSVFCWRS